MDDLIGLAFNNEASSPTKQSKAFMRIQTDRNKKSITNDFDADRKASYNFSEAVVNRALEIGIKEKEFYWIAQKSINVELPRDWIECITEDGYVYYFNDKTEESLWEHPSLDFYKDLYKKKLIESKGNKNEFDSNSQDSHSYYSDSQQSTYRDEHDDEEENINTIQSQVSPVPIPGLISPTPMKEKILRQQAEIGIPGLLSPSPLPPTRKKSSFNETIPTFSPKKSPHSTQNNSNNNSAMNSPAISSRNTSVKGLVIPPSPQSNSKAAWSTEPSPAGGFNSMLSSVPISGLVSPTPIKEKIIKELPSPNQNVQFTNTKYGNEIIAQYSGDIHSKNDQDYDDDSSRGDYWHGRFENLAIEKSRLEVLNNKMEVILQQSVIDQSKAYDELHKTTKAAESLRKCGEECLLYLEKKGFNNNKEWNMSNLDITAASSDLLQIVHLLQSTSVLSDDQGYINTWEGLGNRLQTEFHSCFTYDSDGGLRDTDFKELFVRVEMLVQLVSTFGEYLQPDQKRIYITSLLKHILNNAENQTLVPMELMVEQLSDNKNSKSKSSNLSIYPPSGLSELKIQLEEEKSIVAALQVRLDNKTKENEALNTKVSVSQARLEDAQSREEAMLNKFILISKGMEDIKDAQKIGQVSVPGFTPKDIIEFQNTIKSLENELECSNNRATEAERRNEEMLAREKEIQEDVSNLEDELVKKLEKKSKKFLEAQDKITELETVTQEMYEELQKALGISSRLDMECQTLRLQLDLSKGGEKTVEKLRSMLDYEVGRSKGLDQKIVELKDDLDKSKNVTKRLEEFNITVDAQVHTLKDELKKRVDEVARLNGRIERVQDSNSSLEQKIVSYKKDLISMNDRISDLQGNIRVFCRIRPISLAEKKSLHLSDTEILNIAKISDYNSLEFNSTPYQFDRVFGIDSEQSDVFDEIEPAVKSVMNGCRLCIFAYGQTGSGKTFTMMGPANNQGVNTRAFECIFTYAARDEDSRTDIKMSMLEVYNEKVVDLLTDVKATEGLEVRMGKEGVFVEGLSEWPVTNLEEVNEAIKRGGHSRTVASNNVNEHSSRSHLVILVRVDRENHRTGLITAGFMYLVDLAGSERIKTTGASGERLREAQHINKSLSSLGDVISAMATNQKHIPYRNSKLTFLLKDALKENTKCIMFANVNPIPEYSNESICSLNFAARCRSVNLGQAKQQTRFIDNSNNNNNEKYYKKGN